MSNYTSFLFKRQKTLTNAAHRIKNKSLLLSIKIEGEKKSIEILKINSLSNLSYYGKFWIDDLARKFKTL